MSMNTNHVIEGNHILCGRYDGEPGIGLQLVPKPFGALTPHQCVHLFHPLVYISRCIHISCYLSFPDLLIGSICPSRWISRFGWVFNPPSKDGLCHCIALFILNPNVVEKSFLRLAVQLRMARSPIIKDTALQPAPSNSKRPILRLR